MTSSEIREKLYEFIKPSYPNIKIDVIDADKNVQNLYFTEKKFKFLFPKQRYHYLVHLIPKDFYEQNLRTTIWFELAPNENPDDLDYHDQETIDNIKADILRILKYKVNFVSRLDNLFISKNVKCFGDFRHSKKILNDLGFSKEDQFDIFHVLMNEGGYCDCEILFNIFRESKYSKKYWKQRQE